MIVREEEPALPVPPNLHRELPGSRAAKPYLSAEDLADLTPFTEDSIRTMVKRRELTEGTHFFRVGRRLVFKWQAIVNFIENRSTQSIPLFRGGGLGEPAKA